MIQKGFFCAIVALSTGLLLAGCSSSNEANMSKDDMEALRNPRKEIPPEAIEGMKKTIADAEAKRKAEGGAPPGSPPVPPGAAGGGAPPPLNSGGQ